MLHRYFNSHAHVERDLCDISNTAAQINFNSHAHVERDLSSLSLIAVDSDFNSHAHVERDVTISDITGGGEFQLTRSRGA